METEDLDHQQRLTEEDLRNEVLTKRAFDNL
jgi:hypothetical protein